MLLFIAHPMNNPNPPGWPVYIGEYVIIGSHSGILPCVTVNDGVAVGGFIISQQGHTGMEDSSRNADKNS